MRRGKQRPVGRVDAEAVHVDQHAPAPALAVGWRLPDPVADQRTGIVALVTDSYQNGTELGTATALLGDEGPAGLMNRAAVVESRTTTPEPPSQKPSTACCW